MKLNLQNFELNLVQREEGMPIGFSWAVDGGKGPEDCRVEAGDTVRLCARPNIEDMYPTNDEFIVRVESVEGDAIKGRLVISDDVHNNVLVRFRIKYVITCGKKQL